MDLIGRKFLFNDKILDNNKFNDVYYYSVKNVYEVVRVINFKILFWEEHFDRLNNSILKLTGKSIEIKNLYENLNKVIFENDISSGNLKIEIVFDNFDYNLYVYPIKFYYPNSSVGVDVITVDIERKNPNVKTYDFNFKSRVEKIMNENNVYEVLLVDRDGFITEGSRTNVYFIKDNYFFTAPENLILNGVTRINVNKIINDLGFNLIEKCVSKEEIFNFDASFLTSTSSNVLPIDKINNKIIKSSSNTYLEKVINLFGKYLKK